MIAKNICFCDSLEFILCITIGSITVGISEHNTNMTQCLHKKINRYTNTYSTCIDIYTNAY